LRNPGLIDKVTHGAGVALQSRARSGGLLCRKRSAALHSVRGSVTRLQLRVWELLTTARTCLLTPNDFSRFRDLPAQYLEREG